MDEQTPRIICDYLGLDGDRSLVRSIPTDAHRCFRVSPTHSPDLEHQTKYCLSGDFASCPIFRESSPPPFPDAAGDYEQGEATRWWPIVLGIVLLALALTLVVFYASKWFAAPPPAPEPTASELQATPTATGLPSQTPPPAIETPENEIRHAVIATPSPVPGGSSLVLRPSDAGVGWWTNQEGRRGAVGDSFLYAGTSAGADLVSAVSFDLRRIARGAEIVGAELVLTGLRDVRAQPDLNADWVVQLIPGSDARQLYNADYKAITSAPAPYTFPPINTRNLSVGSQNVLTLDEEARRWLEQLLIDGETGVVARIQAWTDSNNDLFAWDSGTGTESMGYAPELVVNVGPPPPTPPPTPTRPFIVATLSPEPANQMTAVALAATATSVATSTGTFTPVPFAIQTPTPLPANIATQAAIAVQQGLPPIVFPTPSPATDAEATELAVFPTLVALLTGTFTPTPTEYVTPIIVLPSPPPASLATAAARALEATAQVSDSTRPTATPLPYNAVLGVYVYATPTVENAQTAAAMAPIHTAEAIVNGTPTPLPWYAVVITASPTPTPTKIPILIDSTVTPSATPTAPPSILPDILRGKILFKSNRGGSGASTFLLDPETGVVAQVTQEWVYELARNQLTYSPDGMNFAYVAEVGNTVQIFVHELVYDRTQQVTRMEGFSYDPAWSPDSTRIAFTGTEPGNDEIFVTDWDRGEPVRLTYNPWEWDKHPSWSPDGRQIVFYSNRDTGRRQLWVMNADGTDQRNLSDNQFEDWDPIWVR